MKRNCRRISELFFSIVLFSGWTLMGHAFAQDSTQGDGYAVWSKAGPSSEWRWDPIVTSGRIATLSSNSSGTWALRFSLSEKCLGGFNPKAAHVGIVSGQPGSEPKVWITPEKCFDCQKSAGTLLCSTFGDAALRSAHMRTDSGNLLIELSFDSQPALQSGWDMYALIDTDGDPKTGFLGGDFLLQNVSLKDTGAGVLNLAWFEIRPGIEKTGEQVAATAIVHNASARDINGVELRLLLPEGVSASDKQSTDPFAMRPGEVRRVVWKVSAARTGEFRLAVEAEAGSIRIRRSQWLSVVAKRDPKREFQTVTGAWLPYPERPTLQSGNKEKLCQFKSLPSAKLKHNLFGITAHIPRSTNNEDPFIASNAVDGNLSTCWGSRWWRLSVPFEPEWIQIDMGHEVSAKEVRFLPAWKNSGMPAALKIEVSKDAKKWDVVFDEPNYTPQAASEGDKKRQGVLAWQCFPIEKRALRYVRLTASRLNQGGTSFFCAPMEPFQFRVGEIVVIDSAGDIVASVNTVAKSSSVHTAWYNSPDTIKKTWPLMLKSGVKLNRIGQWGDKLDWAIVEKTKGVYKIDPEADRYITESVNAGIDILLTLNYGNNLYQKIKDMPTWGPKDSPDWGPTWHYSHPFLQGGPTTPETAECFANYCAFMAKHFRGRVKYFEIWNEENGWFFDAWADRDKVSMARAYGRVLAAAAKAVKQVNPDAVVIFGGIAGSSLDFPRIAMEEGAGQFIDIFAFHPYGLHPQTPESTSVHFLTAVGENMELKPRPANITNYEEEINAYKEVFRRYNPNIQVWADEMNWLAPGEPAKPEMLDKSELTQAKHLARFFALNSWLGCGAVWWSLYNSNGIQEWAVIRSSDMTPRAAYYSAGYVSTVLDDVKGIADVNAGIVGEAPKDLMVKVYRNGHGELLVGLWRTSIGDDSCTPLPVTLRLAGIGATSAELVDTLYGYKQAAVVKNEKGGIVVSDLLVGDWPLFFRVYGKR